jgi:hypothetical protein
LVKLEKRHGRSKVWKDEGKVKGKNGGKKEEKETGGRKKREKKARQ